LIEISAIELGVFSEALLSPFAEYFDGPGVEVDRPARCAGFAACLVQLVADRDE
jgi:hypothetical protein